MKLKTYLLERPPQPPWWLQQSIRPQNRTRVAQVKRRRPSNREINRLPIPDNPTVLQRMPIIIQLSQPPCFPPSLPPSSFVGRAGGMSPFWDYGGRRGREGGRGGIKGGRG